MGKKLCKMLLGVVMSVCLLMGRISPLEAEAASDVNDFFTSCSAAAGDGQITVKYTCKQAGDEQNLVEIFVYDRADATLEELTESPQSDLQGVGFLGYGDRGSYTFTELINGKTYYVYMCAYADGKDIPLFCLGAFTPFWSDGKTPYETYLERLEAQINCAEAGSVVEMEKGITSVNNAIMKALLRKGDVSLKLEYSYEDTEYVVIIPAGGAVDDDIPWYGPLYLAARYGNRAGFADTKTDGVYIVKSGDCLSKIAAANGMTLAQLAAKNPQISDVNFIKIGQKINL